MISKVFQYVVREAEGTKETKWLVSLMKSLVRKFGSASPIERLRSFQEKNIRRKVGGKVEANVVEKALFRCSKKKK